MKKLLIALILLMVPIAYADYATPGTTWNPAGSNAQYEAGTTIYFDWMNLTDTELLSSQFNYSFLPDSTTTYYLWMVINATDNVSGSRLTNFNVTWNDTIYESNGNGTVYLPSYNQIIDFTVNVSNGNGVSVTSFNSSSNYTASIGVQILNINLKELGFNTTLTGYNLSINGSAKPENTTTYNVNATTYNISITKDGYYVNDDFLVTVPTTTVVNQDFNASKYKIKVKAYDARNDTLITDFRLYYNTLDNFSYPNNVSTTNGSVEFLAQNITGADYNLTIYPSLYEFKEHNFSITKLGYNNYNFSLYSNNSISINYYYENNGSIADDITIILEYFTETYSGNDTTTNGTIFLTSLEQGEYTLHYYASGYTDKYYYFTLNDNEHHTLFLYLTNESTSSVTATVYDLLGYTVENATIKVLRHMVHNNSFVQVAMEKTNFEGETVLPLILNTVYYKFILTYNNILRDTTEKTKIFDTTVSFQIDTSDEPANVLHQVLTVDTYLGVDNNTVRYVYTDDDNLAESGCVYLYETSQGTNTLLTSNCTTGTSGDMTLFYERVNTSTYKIDSTITQSGTEYLVQSKYIDDTISDVIKSNKVLFLAIFFILGIFSIGLVTPITALIFLALALLAMVIIGTIPTIIGVPLIVLDIIIIIIIAKKYG